MTAVVLTQARLAITRVQKKRNRRNARLAAKLPGEALFLRHLLAAGRGDSAGGTRPPEVPVVALEGGAPAPYWGAGGRGGGGRGDSSYLLAVDDSSRALGYK